MRILCVIHYFYELFESRHECRQSFSLSPLDATITLERYIDDNMCWSRARSSAYFTTCHGLLDAKGYIIHAPFTFLRAKQLLRMAQDIQRDYRRRLYFVECLHYVQKIFYLCRRRDRQMLHTPRFLLHAVKRVAGTSWLVSRSSAGPLALGERGRNSAHFSHYATSLHSPLPASPPHGFNITHNKIGHDMSSPHERAIDYAASAPRFQRDSAQLVARRWQDDAYYRGDAARVPAPFLSRRSSAIWLRPTYEAKQHDARRRRARTSQNAAMPPTRMKLEQRPRMLFNIAHFQLSFKALASGPSQTWSRRVHFSGAGNSFAMRREV